MKKEQILLFTIFIVIILLVITLNMPLRIAEYGHSFYTKSGNSVIMTIDKDLILDTSGFSADGINAGGRDWLDLFLNNNLKYIECTIDAEIYNTHGIVTPFKVTLIGIASYDDQSNLFCMIDDKDIPQILQKMIEKCDPQFKQEHNPTSCYEWGGAYSSNTKIIWEFESSIEPKPTPTPTPEPKPDNPLIFFIIIVGLVFGLSYIYIKSKGGKNGRK